MRTNTDYNCPVEATIDLIGGKYKAIILWYLMNKTLRYSELHRLIPRATDKMLCKHFIRSEERRVGKECG